MKHRLWLVGLALLVVTGLLTTGCDQLITEDVMYASEPPPIEFCGEELTVTLWAGQHIDAGTVTVANTPDSLYVTYTTTGGWMLTETHLAVEIALADIPQNKKHHPKVGHFEFKTCHNPAVTEYTYAIPLGDWEPGDILYIAAHAVVVKDGCGSETGWGEGTRFVEKGTWAMWFNYEVQECCCPLPHGPQDVQLTYTPSGESYWKMVFANVPEGNALRNGLDYLGWCVDQYITLSPGWYQFPVYCSHSPNLPAHLVDDDWDMVNWVINHKHPQASMMDIQQAIWYFVNGGHYPTDPQAKAMVDDALANGEGFMPAYCQVNAAIIDAGTKKQCTIIEVAGCAALCCEVLPPGNLETYLKYPAPNSYWEMTYRNVPAGYGIQNKSYLGWCIEQYITIQQNRWYEFPVWCTNHPDMPSYMQDPDWSYVNWIINHKHPDASNLDVQQAIWYFINGGHMPTDPQAKAMVDDALANGKWYRPGWGEICAIAIDAGERLQCTFIEVLVDELVCEY